MLIAQCSLLIDLVPLLPRLKHVPDVLDGRQIFTTSAWRICHQLRQNTCCNQADVLCLTIPLYHLMQ